MGFPTDWEVEKYRTEHECEEHWELRRRFLETHKDKFPEDRLVCLAQVFYNVEFMGCRYPEETMRVVAELSKGVADDHREKMKTKLQRTFVQASDAASSKVKGQKRHGSEAAPSIAPKRKAIAFCRSTDSDEPLKSNTDTVKKPPEISVNTVKKPPEIPVNIVKKPPEIPVNPLNGDPSDEVSFPGRYVLTPELVEIKLKKQQKMLQKRVISKVQKKAEAIKQAAVDDNSEEKMDISNQDTINLVEESQGSKDLQNLKQKSDKKKKKKKKLKLMKDAVPVIPAKPPTMIKSEFQLDSEKGKMDREILSKVILIGNPDTPPLGVLHRSFNTAGITMNFHKEQTENGIAISILANGKAIGTAVGPTLEKARTDCISQVMKELKKQCYTLIVKDQLAGSVVDKAKTSNVPAVGSEAATFNSAVGRMMAKMGWGGGGLGKEEQGRKEPVQAVENVSRAGLGREVRGKQFESFILKMLSNYKNSNASHDLVFAADFTKEERKTIHMFANRRGLRSVSYGKDLDRQLVVSRKRSLVEIAKEVEAAGGSTPKYDLIPPSGV